MRLLGEGAMTVKRMEQIQPIVFGCALWALSREPPVNLDIAVVGVGLDGYVQNQGAYYLFCDNLTKCFNEKTKEISGSSNNLRLTLTWRNSKMALSLGNFIAEASLEAAKQANGHPPTGSDHVA